MTVKAVIPSYMNNIMQRYVQMVEATLRTEALLLGEEHYSATPALEWMIRDAKPRQKHDDHVDPMLDAVRYAMMYSSGMHKISAPTTGRAINNVLDEYLFKDVDFAALEQRIVTTARTTGKSQAFTGMFDTIMASTVEEATPPRASMAWPSSHQGKKGPAPHKPFRK